MEIKILTGEKEVISPLFDIRLNKTKNSIMLCLKNFSNEEQKLFSKVVDGINKNNFILNSNYIALDSNNVIYFFDLSSYKDQKIENMLITGYYDFMFAFVNENDKIIEQDYLVMKLHGHTVLSFPENKKSFKIQNNECCREYLAILLIDKASVLTYSSECRI